MKIYKMESYEKMSEKTAALIAAQIVAKPDSVIGLATGSTPEGAYALLAKWCQEGLLDFSQVKTVNLDEYKGLSPEDSHSYRYFMNQNLFDHINIDKANTYVPNGLEMDSKVVCEGYEAIIDELGGIDLQLLGMGHNGHIGFTEPDTYFEMNTRCMDLTESTIEANKRNFNCADEVPKQAYTMGIGTIMRARKIVIAVCGEDKAETLAKVINGPVTPEVPASILLFHPDVTLVADEAALSKI